MGDHGWLRPMGVGCFALVSADFCAASPVDIYLTAPSIALPIHPESPPLGAHLHHVLPLDRLPGRPACCPPAGSPPDPAPGTRSASIRIVPVRGRRGQGRQVRQQRLCRPDHHACARLQGRHEVPAAARPDRGPCQLRIPSTPVPIEPPQLLYMRSTNAPVHCRVPSDGRRCALSANPSSSELH
jgi:hypothetical protein